jgi:hypothetical protein
MPILSPMKNSVALRTQRWSTPPALQDRILFTLYKGIANLRRYPVQQHAGVVLFRPDASGRSAVIAFIRNRLPGLIEMDLAGRLTVVGPSRIRFR